MSSTARLHLGTLAVVVFFVPAALPAQEEPRYVEVAQLLASDANFGDEFGEEVAIDGDTLVVGGDDIGDGAV